MRVIGYPKLNLNEKDRVGISCGEHTGNNFYIQCISSFFYCRLYYKNFFILRLRLRVCILICTTFTNFLNFIQEKKLFTCNYE